MVDMPKIISTLLYKKTTPTGFGKLRYALELVYGNDEKNDSQLSQSMLYAELLKVGVSESVLQKGAIFTKFLQSLLKYEGLNDDIDYINDGYNAQIDELRQIAYHSDSLLLAYQQELVQATGVTNVKIKYVSNQ